ATGGGRLVVRARAGGSQGGLAGAPETRAGRLPPGGGTAPAAGALPGRCALGRCIDGGSARVCRRQMRVDASVAGALLSPVRPVTKSAPFPAREDGVAGAWRLPRNSAEFLEPDRSRTLPCPGVSRTWLSSGFRGSHPFAHRRESAVYG